MYPLNKYFLSIPQGLKKIKIEESYDSTLLMYFIFNPYDTNKKITLNTQEG